MPKASSPSSAVLSTERVIAASPSGIYAAFEQPEKLAKWWGPNGFTNTFEQFEFRPGGRWSFVMYGPDGANYPNENVFRELQPGVKIVIDHVVNPIFSLTVTLTPQGDRTLLTWDQEFETAELADKLHAICEPANEQNLNRLEVVLGTQKS